MGNTNQPDAPPIRAVLTGENRPFGTHVQTIKDDSTEPASQQWAVPCKGGVSFHSVADRIGLPVRFGRDSSAGKPLVSSSRFPRASSTQKRTTKW